MPIKTQSFLIFLFLFFCGCQRAVHKQAYNLRTKSLTDTSALIPIDFSDSNYMDLESYAVDTMTDDGWSIKYFVKNDSTKYKDIYIVCGKGSIKAVERMEDFLEFRRYFIPEFKAETESHIFFTHGCATDCWAVLVFDKDSTAQFTDYLEVVKYNFQFGQVLYVTDKSYQNRDKVFELGLADVSKHKTYKITFHGICDGAYKPDCVDTVTFSKQKFAVTVSLRNSIKDTIQTKHTKTINL